MLNGCYGSFSDLFLDPVRNPTGGPAGNVRWQSVLSGQGEPHRRLVAQSGSAQSALLDGQPEDLACERSAASRGASRASHPYTLDLAQADLIAATVIQLGRTG